MMQNVFEPGHEKMCLMTYANNKGADQPSSGHCQDRMIPLVNISEVSRFLLVSVAKQVSSCLTWSETPEAMFSHDEAHLVFH